MTEPQSVAIPGLDFDRFIDADDIAERARYRQDAPLRYAAVTVFRGEALDTDARARFESYAALMTTVSAHPSIVTVYSGGFTDTARPYLVSEYCSGPTLAERIRSGALDVPEVLHTMIRLSGAVQSAHDHGITHGDISPTSILSTDYGWPALSDFALRQVADPTLAPQDASVDVRALALTATALLSGPDGAAEAPAALRAVLDDAVRSPSSAMDLARALQRIEHELHLPITDPDLAAPVPIDEQTVLRAPDEATVLRPRIAADLPEDRTVVRDSAPIDDEHTVIRARARPESEPSPDVFDERTVLRSAPIDERTVLRASAPLDEHTVLRGAPLDERTVLRGEAPDDRTVVRGAPADERTILRGETPEDLTLMRASPSTAPAAPAGDVIGRRAFDPSAQRTSEATYGIRETVADTPIVRMPSQPQHPDLVTAPSGARRARNRRLRTGIIVMVVVGALVLVVAAGAVVVLLTAG